VVIPTLYVRDGDSVLLHGSTSSGIASAARRGSPLSVAVTLVDGLVVARSAFESSVNYRSVVIHGQGALLDGDAHRRALDLMVEGLIPGRLADIREPTELEMRKTAVVSVPLGLV
jgi:nitroimidazol reductase NimA-like FMN-containing flavoprotein (pyridoxamine 5'-phosphate oxidase superfamily)